MKKGDLVYDGNRMPPHDRGRIVAAIYGWNGEEVVEEVCVAYHPRHMRVWYKPSALHWSGDHYSIIGEPL